MGGDRRSKTKMPTLISQPFAVLGKESLASNAASAQGAAARRAARAVPKSPPRIPRGSADLASPRSPPKVTQASQSEETPTERLNNPDDVAPMVRQAHPSGLNARVARRAPSRRDSTPVAPPRSPPKLRTPAGGGPRSSPENPRPRKRALVTFSSQELSALPFTPPPDEAATDDGDPIADLLDHLSAALDSADAVRAAICDGDEATQRSVARVAAALDSEQTSSGADRRAVVG